MPEVRGPLGCECGGAFLALAFAYDRPPAGETPFGIPDDEYARELHRCSLCAHFVSRHTLDLGALYGGGYVDATYGERMRATYERVLALPADRSDNHWRVLRVVEFAASRLVRDGASVLDVGSGLCVFLARLKEHGWACTALDPDPRAAAHARDVVGVEAVCGDFLAADAPGRYDAVTFNKVLEHVDDPVAMLSRAHDALAEDGFVYLEVPDGEAAAVEGPGREEFFVEHLHAFSPPSVALAARRAGFSPLRIERLREPSGKFTLAAFLEPAR